MSNIIITNELIESKDPCKSGIDNFNEHYPQYKNTLSHLLALEKISYSDKMWLCQEVITDVKIWQQWAVECAEKVLDNYNKVYPEDNRITNCLEVTKLFIQGEATRSELDAAESAARSAAESAACSAHSAACSAAYYARSAAACSARSAARYARSAAARSARSAYSAADSAYSARSAEENLNLSILISLLENA